MSLLLLFNQSSSGLRAVTPAVGVEALSGNAPSIVKTFVITPATGTETIAGHAPGIAKTSNLSPSTGAETVTGKTPNLTRGINPGHGSESIAGQTSSITKTINPIQGAESISGRAATVTKGTNVTTLKGSEAVVGSAPNLTRGVNPGHGSETVTGHTPVITKAISVTPVTGSESDLGHTPAVVAVYRYSPSVGSETLAGHIAGIVRGTTVQALTGTETLAGHPPTLTRGINPLRGAESITGHAPSLTRSITPITGAETVTGQTPSLAKSTTKTPATGLESLLGRTPDIFKTTRVTPLPGIETTAGHTPSLVTIFRVSPASGQLTMVGRQVVFSQNITPLSGHETTVGQTPGVDKITSLTPVPGTVNETGLIPGVHWIKTLTALSGHMTAVGQQPSYVTAAPLPIQPALFPLCVKSTVDQLLSAIATSKGYVFFDLDGSYLSISQITEALTIGTGSFTCDPHDRDPFYRVRFDIAVKTTNDESQYESLKVFSLLERLFSVGSTYYVSDYSQSTLPTNSVGEMVISSSRSLAPVFDQEASFRNMFVEATVQRYPVNLPLFIANNAASTPSDIFPMSAKSTMDYLLFGVASENGYKFFDMDGAYLATDTLKDEGFTIGIGSFLCYPQPRDPFFYMEFEVAIKTSNDISQYDSMRIFSVVQDLFSVGQNFSVMDYTSDMPATSQGQFLVSDNDARPPVFDQTSTIRSIYVSGSVQRMS